MALNMRLSAHLWDWCEDMVKANDDNEAKEDTN
jgi:hypothetical protein